MLKHALRAPTVDYTLSLLSVRNHEETAKEHPSSEKGGPAHKKIVGDLFPATHNGTLTSAEWIEKILYRECGVISSIPKTKSREGATVALDQRAASGHAKYWEVNLKSSANLFNPQKNTSARANSICVEAVTLHTKVPNFFPEGEAFGVEFMDTDAYIDSGFKVEIREAPYGSNHETVVVKTNDRQMSSCCSELALLFSAAERGIAPAVLACFFSDGGNASGNWLCDPKSAVSADMITPRNFAQVPRLVTVSQLSTFTLNDVMWAIRSAPVLSQRDHLIGVLKDICAPTFAKIKELSRISSGFGMVKLNMHPETVVFCPELVANSENGWTLHGNGYMPISDAFVDGVPKLVDYNSLLTTRVRESSYSEETAFVMECMLMLSFSRAVHGPVICDVLWKHLLAEGDPSTFVESVRAIESKSTNTSAFLACIAANSEMREQPEVAKAIAGVVSDMDGLVRSTIITTEGRLNENDTPFFTKLVTLVTASSEVDTRILKSITTDTKIEEDAEREHRAAMNNVKKLRLQRLARVSQ